MSLPIRINKYLASLGIASRRKIDQYIDEKRIIINGRLAKNGDKIDPDIDQIEVDHRPIQKQPKIFEYIILNKPTNILSSVSDNHGRKTVIDLINTDSRLYPVGRLDYATTGLILLTNDGDLAYRLTHPKYHFPKTYIASVSSLPNNAQLDLLRSGVPLEDGITAKSDVTIFHNNSNNTDLKITLYQGKNRQIRRMLVAVGLNLISLKRISIGPILLGNLREGEWRRLSSDEIKSLKLL